MSEGSVNSPPRQDAAPAVAEALDAAQVFVDQLTAGIRRQIDDWRRHLADAVEATFHEVAVVALELAADLPTPDEAQANVPPPDGEGTDIPPPDDAAAGAPGSGVVVGSLLAEWVERSESGVVAPLRACLARAELGARLESLALDLLRLGHGTRSAAGEGTPATARAFMRSLREEELPEAVEKVVSDAATDLLERTARVTSATTRWIRELSRIAADSEAPAELAHRAEALAGAAKELRLAVAADRWSSVAAAITSRLSEALAEFDPERRKWRAGGEAEAETGAESEPPGEREPPALPERLSRIDLPRRFAAEENRLALALELLRFEGWARRFPDEVLLSPARADVDEASRQLREAIDGLRRLEGEATEWFDGADHADRSFDVDRAVRAGRAAITRASHALENVIDAGRAEAGIGEGLAALLSRVGDLPDDLMVAPLLDEDESVRPGAAGRPLDVRDWALDALDPAALDRLSDAAAPYEQAMRAASAALLRALDVLEYNLGAATRPEELPEEDGEALQRELIVGGLGRAAARLGEAAAALDDVVERGPGLARARVDDVLHRLQERARGEAGVSGHARDALGAVRQSGRRGAAQAERTAGAALRRAGAILRYSFRVGSSAIRRARSAVGATPVDAARADETTRELSRIDSVAAGLPFVYRRLFSYRPLEDPALLAGRDAEGAILDRQLEAWEGGGCSPGLLIVGTSGVGVTSLLRTTAERWFGRVSWRAVPLGARVEDEAAWTAVLARTLEIDRPTRTLAELEAAVTDRPRPAIPIVCAIENVEHLYFRGVLARGLIGPTLKFVAATDSSILWLATIPASAWEVIRATDPGLSALLRVLPLAALARDDVEAAVLARHRRSGIPLEYVESPDLPLGVRRALAKTADPEERRGILEKAFFDRLYDLSEGYVALAMLYWLRAIAEGSTAESMSVRWPEPIDFAAWSELDRDAGFALRAFLEHGTLTIGEYARLFGVDDTVAFAVFERLGSYLIIEATGVPRPVGDRLSFDRVTADRRYRIRPVLVRPVERLLIARRLLY